MNLKEIRAKFKPVENKPDSLPAGVVVSDVTGDITGLSEWDSRVVATPVWPQTRKIDRVLLNPESGFGCPDCHMKIHTGGQRYAFCIETKYWHCETLGCLPDSASPLVSERPNPLLASEAIRIACVAISEAHTETAGGRPSLIFCAPVMRRDIWNHQEEQHNKFRPHSPGFKPHVPEPYRVDKPVRIQGVPLVAYSPHPNLEGNTVIELQGSGIDKWT